MTLILRKAQAPVTDWAVVADPVDAGHALAGAEAGDVFFGPQGKTAVDFAPGAGYLARHDARQVIGVGAGSGAGHIGTAFDRRLPGTARFTQCKHQQFCR